jgi:hypothetical protein
MKYTVEKECTTVHCKHIFKSVAILYGTSAFAKCPSCGVMNTLKLETTKDTSQPGTEGGE